MAFWKDPTLKPPFWPDDVEYKNVKHTCKQSLCKIIQAYIEFEGLKELPPISRDQSTLVFRDRSPHASPTRTPPTPHSPHSSSQSSNFAENIVQSDLSTLRQVLFILLYSF